jgi:hypothetical protein
MSDECYECKCGEEVMYQCSQCFEYFCREHHLDHGCGDEDIDDEV